MLLQDQIAEAAGGLLNVHYFGAPSNLLEAIKSARRIALTAEAREFSANVLSRPSQTSLLYAVLMNNLQRPIWIEWRPEPSPADSGYIASNGLPMVERIGALIELFKEDGAVRATFAWSFRDKDLPLTICPLTPIFDISASGFSVKKAVSELVMSAVLDGRYRDITVSECKKATDFVLAGYTAEKAKLDVKKYRLRSSDADIAAIIDLQNRTLLLPNAFCAQFLIEITKKCPSMIPKLYADAYRDLEGDPGLALVSAALIKSGALSIQEADIERLNKARIKTRKPPFLQHEVADLDWNHLGGHRAVGLNREEMRAHLVSGHFKRRATGVFWWRPAIRGRVVP
jgi:hypothetical protein